jgi:hypothetical protein
MLSGGAAMNPYFVLEEVGRSSENHCNFAGHASSPTRAPPDE